MAARCVCVCVCVSLSLMPLHWKNTLCHYLLGKVSETINLCLNNKQRVLDFSGQSLSSNE